MLVSGLRSEDELMRNSATLALTRLGSDAVPAVTEALADKSPETRLAALGALGGMGEQARCALPDLRDALADPDKRVARGSAWAIASVAAGLQGGRVSSAVPELEASLKAVDAAAAARPDLVDGDAGIWKASAARTRTAVEALRAGSGGPGLAAWLAGHPWALTALLLAIYLAAALGSWWVVLLRRPLLILRANEALGRWGEVNLPYVGKVATRDLLLSRWFEDHPRVLDAWVETVAPAYRDNFARLDTVRERIVHVPAPVLLDDTPLPELRPADLAPTFPRESACLLVWGEGGSGKTSLACQVGRWALADDPAGRPAPHRMLPVLIEEELPPAAAAGNGDDPEGASSPLFEAVRGQVQVLAGKADAPPAPLLRQLLKQRRVLVIVDHLSEAGKATRAAVQSGRADFPAKALVVTSRTRDVLGKAAAATATVLQPLRVEGNRLSEFLGAYLTRRGQRARFDDASLYEACARLSRIVGGSRSTVLLVKLYAEQMIARADRDARSLEGDLPANVPDLMVGYLAALNHNLPPGQRRDDRQVRADAQALAWACLAETYHPSPVARAVALDALGCPDPDARLDDLEHRLGLVRSSRGSRDTVSFTLDPLAEYLAALQVVDLHRGRLGAWRSFFEHGPASPSSGNAFLSAVLDCCQASGLPPDEFQFVSSFFPSPAPQPAATP